MSAIGPKRTSSVSPHISLRSQSGEHPKEISDVHLRCFAAISFQEGCTSSLLWTLCDLVHTSLRATKRTCGNYHLLMTLSKLYQGEDDSPKRGTPMFKSFAVASFAIAVGLMAWLLPMQGERATAQSGPLHILVVEYDIVPAEIDNYLKAIKELAAAAVNEPGYRQLSIAVSQKDANHVLLFESWDNKAALDAFLATDRFKKYSATTGNMVAKRDIRTFSSVAMNIKGI